LRNNLANFVRRYRGSSKRRITLEIPIDAGSSAGPIHELLSSSAPSPSGQAILNEQAARFEHALGQLRERDRQVLTWRMQDYCEWKEIGRRIGGSEDKARKVFTRAVARLRRQVGDISSSSPDDSRC
jgi:RNA polymerase sigma-70 factor (ECF subfamily)